MYQKYYIEGRMSRYGYDLRNQIVTFENFRGFSGVDDAHEEVSSVLDGQIQSVRRVVAGH
jgi:hypothetical protein